VPVTRTVAVAVEAAGLHLDRPFDYLVPDGLEVRAGQLALVPFAGRRLRGLVLGPGRGGAPDPARLKSLVRLLGEHVWVREDELAVLQWAAERFGAPLADVLRHALPRRVIDVERRAATAGWFPPGTARRPRSDPPPPEAELAAAWSAYGAGGSRLTAAVREGAGSFCWRPLPGEDVGARLAELAQLTLAGDRDVLLVVPDPASPTADALVRAAGDLVVDLRGGPSPRRTYRGWLEARCGQARVVVGERGAAFHPLLRLGLAVVLDEANPALKERRSPRHHVREVIYERARRAGAVGLAVGTVPSAGMWRLLRERRVLPVVPDRETERRARPRIRLVTGEGQPRARLSREATAALRAAVRAGEYAVVVASRRGEGRALVCRGCGEWLACPACAASLAVPPGAPGLLCEGCGWRTDRIPPCPACGIATVVPLAAGAERLGRELSRSMDVPVAVLEGYAQPAPDPPAVLVMTRGSLLDAPPGPVAAVILPDLDGALRRPSLDAAEDALRLACLASAWTVHGRRSPEHGEVVVQTRQPQHHALAALASWDPGAFWRTEVPLRGALRFPPVGHAMRLTVPAADADRVERELGDALVAGDDLLGPMPEGDRAGFLIKADDRRRTLAALRAVREGWSRAGVDARLDVDPVDAW